MKKNIYLVIIVFALSSMARAQKIEGIAAFIQLGYMNAPNTKIFNQVYPGNAEGFANNYFLIGAEAFYRKNNNVFMGDLQFGLQKVYSFNDQHAGAVYEAVLVKYGWIIKEEKNFWLYPSAGTGASVISLTSYSNSNRIETMKTQTLVSRTFDIGMNSDFLLSKLKWKENYYLGWMMGIKAGYRFSIKSNKWKNDNAGDFYKINEMPPYTNNAFYVTFSFGGGSFDKK